MNQSSSIVANNDPCETELAMRGVSYFMATNTIILTPSCIMLLELFQFATGSKS